MGSRIKLITGGIVLLASGGSGFAVFKNISTPLSFSPPNSLNLSSSNWDNASPSRHLEINSSSATSQGVNLSAQSFKNVSLELIPNTVSNLDLQQSQLISIKKPNIQIKKIVKEIKKSTGIQRVQDVMTSKTKASKRKVKRQVGDYDETLKIVKENISKISQSATAQIPKLTYKQRKSLYDHLKEFAILSLRRNHILKQLEKVKNNGVDSRFERIRQKYIYLKIADDLVNIGWLERKGLMVKKSQISWGDWVNQNPFRHFFDREEEWKTLWGQFTEEKTNVKSNLEFRIAKKLLEIMEQIESSPSTTPESLT